MKPTMLFSIIAITAIILASSFGLHIMPLEPIHRLPDDILPRALYVCPAASSVWDPVAMSLQPYIRYINMFFFFVIMLLMFGWGWALYQNLLKDSFKQDVFKNPWAFTKIVFWLAVAAMLLVWTPNSYKGVRINGAEGKWILCEENSPGALPVLSNAVKR
ncbi:MAG: hypothetical protein LBD50_03655 [Rickettsiales bacterium]|jgi:hypothetical protein|nr:hypothetical protein [Rickettsiales bacterium]